MRCMIIVKKRVRDPKNSEMTHIFPREYGYSMLQSKISRTRDMKCHSSLIDIFSTIWCIFWNLNGELSPLGEKR